MFLFFFYPSPLSFLGFLFYHPLYVEIVQTLFWQNKDPMEAPPNFREWRVGLQDTMVGYDANCPSAWGMQSGIYDNRCLQLPYK